MTACQFSSSRPDLRPKPKACFSSCTLDAATRMTTCSSNSAPQFCFLVHPNPVSLLHPRLQPRKSPLIYSSNYVLRVTPLLRSHLLPRKVPAQYLQLPLPPRCSASPSWTTGAAPSKARLRSVGTRPATALLPTAPADAGGPAPHLPPLEAATAHTAPQRQTVLINSPVPCPHSRPRPAVGAQESGLNLLLTTLFTLRTHIR